MRYRYLAIEGNIGAGKTSLSMMLAEELNAQLILEEFADNPFLAKFYEDKERYAFPLELSFLAERFSQLKKELSQPDLFRNYVVSDYFLSKSLIFSRANLEGDEYALFSKMFYLILQQLPKPDLLVYLYLDVDQLQENIKKRGRPYEQGIKNEYLESIQRSYFNFIRQQKDQRVLVINTNKLDFVNSPEDYKRIKEIINVDYDLGVHHVEP
jgi:deoxyadenosine/deoxycytidine kinase